MGGYCFLPYAVEVEWKWLRFLGHINLHPVNPSLNWPIRRFNYLLIAPQLQELFLTFDGAIEQNRPINSYNFCSMYHKWIKYNSKWYCCKWILLCIVIVYQTNCKHHKSNQEASPRRFQQRMEAKISKWITNKNQLSR